MITTFSEVYYEEADFFSYENGFSLAVALTAYDDRVEPYDDPTYGEIIFNHFTWGLEDENGDAFSRRVKLNTHYCTREELGLAPQRKGARFFETNERFIPHVELYAKKYMCTDEDQMRTAGDYNSAQASLFNV